MSAVRVLTAILMTVLKILGITLLSALVLLTAAALLILFVPIRYEIYGRIDDPKGSEEVNAEALKENARFWFRCSWLFHFLQGGIEWPAEHMISLQIGWIRVDATSLLEKITSRDKDSGKDREEKAPKGARRGSIREALSRGAELLRWLSSDHGRDTLRKVMHCLAEAGKSLLPTQWEITGVVGLGDPADAASLIEAESLLMPFVGGHVWITPEFTGYRFDLQGRAKGRIRLWDMVRAAVRMLRDPGLKGLGKALFVRETVKDAA